MATTLEQVINNEKYKQNGNVCLFLFFFLIAEVEMTMAQSPLARSPEVRGGSALCMPNILCFKVRTHLYKQTHSVFFFKK